MHVGEAVKSLVPPTEWLKVNSQIVNLVQKWADRDDLMVAIGPGRGGATAFFDPKMAQIEVNTDIAFGEKVDPSLIGDLNLRQVQFEYPKGTGAILHEAAHARYTTYDLKTAFDALGEKAYDALMMLEESRIENLILDEYPANRSFLRSCILEIVLKEESEEEVMKLSGTRRAARLAQLALARVDTKVLKKKDVKTYRSIIEKILGADLLVKLRNIWTEFQNIKNPDRQLNRMYTLAREWADLIDEAAKDDDAREEELQKMMEAIMEALGSQVGSTEIDAQGDVYQQQTQEKWDEQQKEKEKRDKEKAENENAANQVFSKSVQVPKDSKTTGGNGQDLRYQNSYSRQAYSREPTGEERSAAVTVSHALEKAKYHDRIRIESNSTLPPGRLRTRAAVQNSAYKSMNVRIQAEPFRRVQRKHQIDPNLTVGVMFDISGSMGGAMEPMGATAWVMSEAVKKIQGTFAMVSYGYDVNPIVKKGQHQEKVSIHSAPDGSEAFSLGFAALDGALELLNGTGARLLVVVSDGNYKGSEVEGAKKWLKRCEQEGVAVLWLGYGHSSGAEAICQGTNANLVIPASTAAEVAQQVGKAATDVLNRTGSSKV